MEPGLSLQFISGLPREMLFSFYFTGDSPKREPQLKRPPFAPVLRQNPTGQGAFRRRRKNSWLCLLRKRPRLPLHTFSER